MKQTIEIEVPNGKKAVWKDNKVIFEDIKPQLPKTWKEYVTFHFPVDKFPENHYACAKTSLFSCHTTNSDYESVLQTKNILTSDKTIKQHLALMQLHQLRDYYINSNDYANDYLCNRITNINIEIEKLKDKENK